MIGMKMELNYRVWWAPLLVSLGLLGVLVVNMDFSQVRPYLAKAEWSWLALVFIGTSLRHLCSSIRLQGLLPKVDTGSRASTCLQITMMYGFYLMVLPARLGEVAYMFLLNRRFELNLGEVSANLLYQRLLDMLVLLLFLVLAALGLEILLRVMPNPEIMALLLLTGGGMLVIWLDKWVTLMALTLVRMQWRTGQLRRKILRFVLHLRRALTAFSAPTLQLSSFLLTVVSWLGMGLATWAALAIFGLQLRWMEIIFLLGGMNLLMAVPLPTVGGIGLAEVGAAGVLTLLGYSLQDTAITAVVLRTILILSNLSLITVGLVLLSWWSATKQQVGHV